MTTAQAADIGLQDLDDSRRWREHPGQQVQQGCFAAAAWPPDKNVFAFGYSQIGNIQDRRGMPLPLEVQVPDMNDYLIQIEKVPSIRNNPALTPGNK